MTDDPRRSDEDVLLELLTSTLEVVEPLSDDVAAASREIAYATRHLDAELLALVEDSALADVGLRSEGDDRQLTFGEADVEVNVSVGEDGSMVGAITPASDSRSIVLETPDGAVAVPVDDLGRFTAATTAGRFRLVITEPGRPRAVTQWVFR